jgi:hypothetical protein
MKSLRILEHLIDERLYETGFENETPNQFIDEVCYRFYAAMPKTDFIERERIKEYIMIKLRNKIDTDFDLNIFRLRFVPILYKQTKDN